MKKIVLITIGMYVLAGSVHADDCRKNDGTSRNGTITDTGVLPVCDDNIATLNPTAQQESIDASLQRNFKDVHAIPEIESLAGQQDAAK